jgi:hypothetical protein
MPPRRSSAQVPRTNADKSINLRCRIVSVSTPRCWRLVVGVFYGGPCRQWRQKGPGTTAVWTVMDGEREGVIRSEKSCANFCLRLRSKLGGEGRGKSRELGVTSMRACGWLRPEVFRSPGDKDGAKTHCPGPLAPLIRRPPWSHVHSFPRPSGRCPFVVHLPPPPRRPGAAVCACCVLCCAPTVSPSRPSQECSPPSPPLLAPPSRASPHHSLRID